MYQFCDEQIREMLRGKTLQALCEFVNLPAKSSDFDPNWREHGYLQLACEKAAQWAKPLFPEATFEVLTHDNHTPALFFDIPATDDQIGTTLFYGHFDKQPEAQGWTNNRRPFVASIEGNCLYGRGCADDGYSFYSALTAVYALKKAHFKYGRITGLIETDEESGSADMPHWLNHIHQKCGNVAFIVVLDSTCCDYDRFWLTTSFRGCVNFTLNVQVLNQGVHSGSAGGIVPDSFRIARCLLDRLENAQTGEIADTRLNHPVAQERLNQIKETANILGQSVISEFPWHKTTQPCHNEIFESLVARGFKPQLCVVGADGLPATNQAGRVMRSHTALALSMRTPPEVDARSALKVVTEILTENPPYSADVTVTNSSAGDGWCAKLGCQWLDHALQSSCKEIFGNPPAYNCDGASIPILNLMQSHFPDAQMLVTGVLGPGSNAHGPDEMLKLDYLEKLMCVIARLLTQVEK